MNTPGRRPSQVNEDIMGNGGAFLTEMKQVTKINSRSNLNALSPDNRNSGALRLNRGSATQDNSPSQSPNNFMSGIQSPSSGQNMLVSFNFLT